MPTISVPYSFTPGTTISSSQVNADFTAVLSGLNSSTLDFVNIKMLDTRAAVTQSWAANVTGDSNARIALTTSTGLQGGPGNAALDVQMSRTAANTWGVQAVGGGAGNIDLSGGLLLHAADLIVNGGRAYGITGAPYQDTTSGGVASIFYGPAVHKYITLIDPGTSTPTTQTFSEVSLSVAALGTVVLDLYVKSASTTTVTLSSVSWAGVNTPPTRQTDALGRLCKNGDTASLLVAVAYVQSNLAFDFAGSAAAINGNRAIYNIYNQVTKALGSTGVNVGPSAAAYPTQVTGKEIFLAPFTNGQESFGYVLLSEGQHSLANGQAGIGVSLNSNVTPGVTGVFQAYAINAVGTMGAALSMPGALAGLNQIFWFTGVVSGGGNVTSSNMSGTSELST
jgi:hypothetical protein